MEVRNHQAMHEPERLLSPDELIAGARMRFEALAAIGVLTQGQARSILRLLEDGETLSRRERAFRDDIVRYLNKEVDFVSVFAEMLQIDKHPAPPRPKPRWNALLRWLAGTISRVLPQPSNRASSIVPTMLKRRWAQISRMSLPPIKTFILPAVIAFGAVLFSVSPVFRPDNTIVASEPRAKRLPLDADARSVPPDPDAAIYPSAISASHADEEPQEASLNTCYDRYKANREINANGGLSWNQSGRGYYSECLKRLKR